MSEEHKETVRERLERIERGEMSPDEAADIRKQFNLLLKHIPKFPSMAPPHIAKLQAVPSQPFGPFISPQVETAGSTHATADAVRELAKLQRDVALHHERERAEDRRLAMWTLVLVALGVVVAVASLIVAAA